MTAPSPTTRSLSRRYRQLPPTDQRAPEEDITITTGRWSDLRQLAPFHYLADKPATATRILTASTTLPTATDRWLNHKPQPTAVAVLTESLPALSCHLRDHALDNRYGTWLPPAERAKLLNQEVRCISRVIVHPQFRGLGLAVRLVRHALATATTPITEALAAMGRINPFFARAGMTAYRRPPLPCDQRLLDALATTGFVRTDLAHPARLWQTIQERPTQQQTWLTREIARWYQHNAGRSGRRTTDPLAQLHAARTRVLLEPVYFVHLNHNHHEHQHASKPPSQPAPGDPPPPA
ncbi:hypothetical protein [Mucisphaera sp.]|uniref:hypothetical protein n=1 Tax=Mucisphaera sp. TaxID=2913024 RepID=UPI003D0FF2D9